MLEKEKLAWMAFITDSFIKHLLKHKNRVDRGEKSYESNIKIPKFLVFISFKANRYLTFLVKSIIFIPLLVLFLILSPLIYCGEGILRVVTTHETLKLTLLLHPD